MGYGKEIGTHLANLIVEMVLSEEGNAYDQVLTNPKHGYVYHGTDQDNVSTYHHLNGSHVALNGHTGNWEHKGKNKKLVATTGESPKSLESHLNKVASRAKSSQNQKWRNDTMKSLGLNKVRGAVSGKTYWESANLTDDEVAFLNEETLLTETADDTSAYGYKEHPLHKDFKAAGMHLSWSNHDDDGNHMHVYKKGPNNEHVKGPQPHGQHTITTHMNDHDAFKPNWRHIETPKGHLFGRDAFKETSGRGNASLKQHLKSGAVSLKEETLSEAGTVGDYHAVATRYGYTKVGEHNPPSSNSTGAGGFYGGGGTIHKYEHKPSGATLTIHHKSGINPGDRDRVSFLHGLPGGLGSTYGKTPAGLEAHLAAKHAVKEDTNWETAWENRKPNWNASDDKGHAAPGGETESPAHKSLTEKHGLKHEHYHSTSGYSRATGPHIEHHNEYKHPDNFYGHSIQTHHYEDPSTGQAKMSWTRHVGAGLIKKSGEGEKSLENHLKKYPLPSK